MLGLRLGILKRQILNVLFIYQIVGDISVHDQSVGLSGMNNKEDLEMTL